MFSHYEFDRALTEIEEYLGYLKGNELAHQYLMDVKQQLDKALTETTGSPTFLSLNGYSFPCPSARFVVSPEQYRWHPEVLIDPMSPEPRFDWDAFMEDVKRRTDEAYKSGIVWAVGIADYLRSVCDRFVKPDPDLMSDAILELQRDVVFVLTDAPGDDWAHLGGLNNRWTGDAAASFNEFYANYNDIIARSARFIYMVNLGATATAHVIAGTRLGALDYVQEMRAGIMDQLDQWAHEGWKPVNVSSVKFPDWVVDVLEIGDKAIDVLADFVPAAEQIKDPKSTLKNIGELVAKVADLTGANLPRSPKRVPVQTADDIYKALTEALCEDYLRKFEQALQQLDSGTAGGADLESRAFSGQGVVRLLEDGEISGDWRVPSLPPEKLTDPDDSY